MEMPHSAKAAEVRLMPHQELESCSAPKIDGVNPFPDSQIFLIKQKVKDYLGLDINFW